MMRKILLLLVAVSALCACTDQQKLALQAGQIEAQGANNSAAQVLRSAPCAMTVGAYFRTLSGLERNAVATLCGG